MFGEKTSKRNRVTESYNLWGIICITLCFSVGRLIQYLAIDIYSTFKVETVHTILWMVTTGAVIGSVLIWFKSVMVKQNNIKLIIILGLVMFGVNMMFFNFFMPLVFDADIPDLIVRTLIDIMAVTAGVAIYTSMRTSKDIKARI